VCTCAEEGIPIPDWKMAPLKVSFRRHRLVESSETCRASAACAVAGLSTSSTRGEF
jgi:hypothetical protein